jgi:ATP-dependent Clp protease protease subunit
MNRFWNFARDGDDGARVLYFDGVIAAESWFDDEISPALFRAELFAGDGDVTLWLNSPGGDCIAASQIYTMLMDYPHDVTVKIDGIAASAASVIAMAGTRVLMAPTALMMVHNPATIAAGDSDEMRTAAKMLDEVKESIINAYEIKTNQSRTTLAHLMDAETWMNANKAIELGFADGILERNDARTVAPEAYAFDASAAHTAVLNKIAAKAKPKTGTPIESLEKRLNLIIH